MVAEEDVVSPEEKTMRRAKEFRDASLESIEAITESTKKGIKDLVDTTNAQVKKVETMTREKPGTALTITFVAGVAIGGVITLLALSRNRKK